jgi:hypothetical protein
MLGGSSFLTPPPGPSFPGPGAGQQRTDRLIITEHFDRRVASFSEVSHVARAVLIGTLRGTPITAEKIAHTIGMPRAVLRKLDYLIAPNAIRLHRGRQPLQQQRLSPRPEQGHRTGE